MAPKANKSKPKAKAGKAKGVKSVSHSDSLVWQCIRNNNAFLRPNKTAMAKNWKKGPRNVASRVFNAEPGHLTGLNGYSCSTLVQGLAVGVQKTGKKETVVVSAKTAKTGKPAKAVAKTGIAKNAKKGAAVLNSFKSKQPKLKISRA